MSEGGSPQLGGIPVPTPVGAVEVPLFTVNVEDVACPDVPTDLPVKMLEDYHRDVFCFLRKFHTPSLVAHIVASLMTGVIGAVLQLSKLLVLLVPLVTVPVGTVVVSLMDELRKVLDEQAANMGVSVLNEILGTSFSAATVSPGSSVSDHIARAQEVGTLFHRQLLSEFEGAGTVTPDSGLRAAERFTGFLVNFGTATGLIGLLGEIASLGAFGEFREIGVQVARNLGLGRMHRIAMRPVLDILIGEPYKWYINRAFTPTQFTAADVVNPFTSSVMSDKTVFDTLTLQGYSPEKIKELIALHRKKLTETDVEILVRYKAWTMEQGIAYLVTLGYPQDLAQTVFNVIELRRADARLSSLVTTLETAFGDGHIPRDTFEAVLESLPLGDVERAWIAATGDYKLQTPHASVTLANMQKAFDAGLADVTQLEEYLARKGYSQDDALLLEQLTLLATAKLADTGAAKAHRAAAAAARAAARAAKKPAKSKP